MSFMMNAKTYSVSTEEISKSCKITDKKLESPLQQKKWTYYWLFCIVTASIGSTFQFGYQLGIFNAPYSVIREFYETTYDARYNQTMSNDTFTALWSLTNGLMPLGGMIGAISSGRLADALGRKNGLMISNILVLIVGVLNISAKFIKSYEVLIIGKFIAGLYCGLFTGILPIYLMEITEPRYRGFAGSMIGISISGGIVVSNLVALNIFFGTSSLWPVIGGFVLLPGIFNLLMTFAVESPKFLYISSGNQLKAQKSLTKLRGASNTISIKYELDDYELDKKKFSESEDIRWSDLWSDKCLRRPLIVSLVINMSQQFCGVNAVSFYSTIIFQKAGLVDDWPVYCTLMVSFCQFAMSFLCSALIDRLGRKSLLLISLSGMFVSCLGISVFNLISTKYTTYTVFNYLIVVCVVGFIISFGAGSGSITNLITVELFASNVRGKANSLACLINWLSNLIVVISFPFVQEVIGINAFFIFAFLLFVFTVFVYFCMTETKNMTVEEIKTRYQYGILVKSSSQQSLII